MVRIIDLGADDIVALSTGVPTVSEDGVRELLTLRICHSSLHVVGYRISCAEALEGLVAVEKGDALWTRLRCDEFDRGTRKLTPCISCRDGGFFGIRVRPIVVDQIVFRQIGVNHDPMRSSLVLGQGSFATEAVSSILVWESSENLGMQSYLFSHLSTVHR